MNNQLHLSGAREDHGLWEESPGLDPQDRSCVRALAIYDFITLFTPASRVLDIGSGKAYGVELLKKTCDAIVNVDLCYESLAYGRLNFGAKGYFVTANATKLPFASGTFNLVVALELIEHIPPQSTGEFLAETGRVTAPGGRLIISTPNISTIIKSGVPRCHFHVNDFTPESFKVTIREKLGPAEYYGLAPDYGPLGNFARKVDVFNVRYVLNKRLGISTAEDYIENTGIRPGLNPLAEARRRARKTFRITKADYKRGQGLIAVYTKI